MIKYGKGMDSRLFNAAALWSLGTMPGLNAICFVKECINNGNILRLAHNLSGAPPAVFETTISFLLS